MLIALWMAWRFVSQEASKAESQGQLDRPQRNRLRTDESVELAADHSAPSGARTPASEATSPVEQPAVSRSARSVLKEYWGNRWSEVERVYLENWCVILGDPNCLDAPVGADFGSWEEATESVDMLIQSPPAEAAEQSQRGAFIDWPQAHELTLDRLRSIAPVPEDVNVGNRELAEISALAADENRQLEQIAVEWRAALRAGIQDAWSRGDIERAPLYVPPAADKDVLHSYSVSARGWAVRITVRRSEAPWLAELIERADALRSARSAQVREYLQSLR